MLFGIATAPAQRAVGQETYTSAASARPSPEIYRRVAIPKEQSRAPTSPEGGASGDQLCPGEHCPPTEAQKAQQLIAGGPDAETTGNSLEVPGPSFAIAGFVKENWPVSVEYAAQPGTVTILTVQLYHQRKFKVAQILGAPVYLEFPYIEVAFQQNLDALEAESQGDDPWHRTVKIPAIKLDHQADPSADGNLRVARYMVRSFRLDGEKVKMKGLWPERVPVDVIGLTVGPEVQGSLTLSGAGFAMASALIPARQQPALDLNYSFRTDRDYNLVRQTIEQYSSGALDWQFQKELGAPASAGAAQIFERSWPVDYRQKAGRYRVRVSAWWNCDGITLGDYLQQCPNNPNWSTNQTAPIELRK